MSDDDAALLAVLRQVGAAPRPGERSDEDIIAGALQQLARGPRDDASSDAEDTPANVVADGTPRRGLVIAFVAGLGLAAAAAFIFFVLRPQLSTTADEDAPGSLAPDQAGETDPGGDARERLPAPSPGRTLGTVVTPPPDLSTSSTGEADRDETSTGETDGATPTDQAEAGETGAGASSRPWPTTADGLLERAQQELRDKRTARALRTYERLLAEFPRSAEATAARVTMGRLWLRRGDAKAALAHFDAYLAASAGGLVEEARYGRIRALRQLGRTAQERGSIEAFLAEHPGSVYAPRLQKRALELDGSP